jgi:hypothetical protein
METEARTEAASALESDDYTQRATIVARALLIASIAFRCVIAFTKSYAQDDFFWSYVSWLRSTNLVPRRDYYLPNFTPLAELFAPLFRLFHQSFVPITIARGLNLLVTFALLWSCYRVARLLGASTLWALIATNLLAWEFQFIKRIGDVRSDQIGALCLMLAAIALLDPAIRRHAFWAGLASGAAVAITYKLLIGAAFLGLGALVVSRSRIRAAIVFSAMTLVSPALYFSLRIWLDGAATVRAVWQDIFGALGSGVANRLPSFTSTIATAPLTVLSVVFGAVACLFMTAGDQTARRRWYAALAVGFIATYIFFNPFLFPYNFVIIDPVLIPLVVGLPTLLGRRLTVGASFLLPLAALTGATFAFSDVMAHTKTSQERVVRWVWSTTGPNDAVFDWQGCVPWRPSIFHWWMYSGLVRHYASGWFSAEAEIRKAEVKIVLPNYRMQALTPSDRHFLDTHFVAIDACIEVPGWIVQGDELLRGMTIDAFLPEDDYVVQPANVAGVLVDGRPLQLPRQHLQAGEHRLTLASGSVPPKQVALVRLTPRMLQSIAPCGRRDGLITWFN